MQNLWFSTSWHFFDNLKDLMNSVEMYKAWNVLQFHRSFPFNPHFATCSLYWMAVCNLLVFTKAFAKCPYLLLLKKTLEVSAVSPYMPMNWQQHVLSCSFLENISYSSSQTLTPKDSFGLWIYFSLALFSLLLKSRHFLTQNVLSIFSLSPFSSFSCSRMLFFYPKWRLPVLQVNPIQPTGACPAASILAS